MKPRPLALLLALALPGTLFAESPPQYADSWPSCGVSVCYPIGLTADAGGNLYVVDGWNDTVQQFLPDGSVGTPVSVFGLNGAHGIERDGNGNFYIANTGSHQVLKFSGTGSLVWATGLMGTGDGQFDEPVDVAVDGSGNVYVVDSNNRRVQKFNGLGTYLTQWGGLGGAGDFDVPQGIAVTGSGTVYVADFSNHRVMRYNSDGSGATEFVSPGINPGQVSFPKGIDVDSAGNVYVVDRGGCNIDSRNCRIQKFSSAGTLLSAWGGSGFGCSGDGCNGKFQDALDVAVSVVGSIYASDLRPIDTAQQGRIQQFSYNVQALPTTWGRLKARYP